MESYDGAARMGEGPFRLCAQTKGCEKELFLQNSKAKQSMRGTAGEGPQAGAVCFA